MARPLRSVLSSVHAIPNQKTYLLIKVVEKNMSGSLDEILKQITDPLDWIAAGLGAGGGIVASVALNGLDLGTSIGAGAIAGVTARKALAASLQGRLLSRRERGLRREILAARARYGIELSKLAGELDFERRLWNSKVISNDQFRAKLDEFVEKLRQLIDANLGKEIDSIFRSARALHIESESEDAGRYLNIERFRTPVSSVDDAGNLD